MPAYDPEAIVNEALEDAMRVKGALRALTPDIVRISHRVAEIFREGGRLYACGNGGSACDSIHLVEELVARYKRERPGLPAHHLLDAPTLTCWSNDYDFESAFRRQVEAMVREGDVLVAISTSGNAPNVLSAVEAAKERCALTVGLTGRDGGRMREGCDEVIIVPSQATERIQEAHIVIIHLLCDIVERALFFNGADVA